MLAQFDSSDTVLRIALNGRLTFAENGAFRQVVEAIGQAGKAEVVFDLGGLDFIDSAGMGMLLVARDAAGAQAGGIRLRRAGGQVGRMLHLAKFADFFTLER
jgi:Anti-anti-sigma regulatory factor (antagonist of anti-sigma factor)